MVDSLRSVAERLLEAAYGSNATFRAGQWEAIEPLLRRQRVLVVQRTGWGKSLVYFLTTRLLREQGSGPTLLISPLLSLMRNQEEMAERLGLRARRIDSTNAEEWREIERELAANQVDLLMVSPERLSNEQFRTRTLQAIDKGIGLFVVDEAHCISDWGHDFRPDYRRIARVVRGLPATVPLLATTATASARVVADIQEQLGQQLTIVRGALGRETLALQNIRLQDQAERLAWLAEHVPALPGSGIIYCSTTRDCDRVSSWLKTRGVDAPAYHGGIDVDARPALEQRLLANDVKALVATVALGMGFDKPDLGFVVHFQKPGSVVDYYQRIGRAGRAVDRALVVLLTGREDDEISEFFIRSAFPSAEESEAVLRSLGEADEGLTLRELQGRLNLRHGKLEQILKLLEIDGAVYRDRGSYFLSGTPWNRDEARVVRITEQRRNELARMQTFVGHDGCLMEFLTRELDDPWTKHCGHCANCVGSLVPSRASDDTVREAQAFLRRQPLSIEPRKRLPDGKLVPLGLRAEPGLALSYFGDAGWGTLIRRGKYQDSQFSDELVYAAAEQIRRWAPEPAPAWVTAVPSLRRPSLVPDFARRLAEELGLPFVGALTKGRETPEQKTMENSAHQARNVSGAFGVMAENVMPGPVLLVDDFVDSRWTLTECAKVLRECGSGAVFPFALANSSAMDGDN